MNLINRIINPGTQGAGLALRLPLDAVFAKHNGQEAA